MRQLLSILLVVILCATSTYAAKPPGSSASIPAQVAQKPTLQEQVLEIPPGSLVVVRLKNKELKLRGRLGELSNEGFILKYTKWNEIKERKVSFDELKSIKSKRGGSKVGKAVVYILAGVGVTFLVVIAFLASGDS